MNLATRLAAAFEAKEAAVNANRAVLGNIINATASECLAASDAYMIASEAYKAVRNEARAAGFVVIRGNLYSN